MDSATAFDAMADAYDESFTATLIGSMMREAVWARCALSFPAGSRILEMNCGTGEDAVWLARRGISVLATDVSSAMLQIARGKAAESDVAAAVRFQCLAWENLATLNEERFDGLLSNFGGLNCVGDLPAVAAAMAAKLRPGAIAIMCIMGPCVPWEWLWYLARAEPAKAFRRLRRNGTVWRGLTIRYPSIARVKSIFSPEFRCLRVAALGAFLPPPYAEGMMSRNPRTLHALNKIERRLDTVWPLPHLADHYVLELERR